MKEVLYHREGQRYVPTEAAGSPWHPGLLHGGAVSGLLCHAISEQMSSLTDMRVTRVTMDFMRPVPRQPLDIDYRWLREGKRLRLLAIEVRHGDKPVARAEAVIQKGVPVSLPDYAPRPALAPRGPDGLEETSIQAYLDGKGMNIPHGLHSRVRLRPLTPWNERGQGTAWLNLPVDTVAGTETCAFTRVGMMCDFGNGVGQLNLGNGVGMINSDITLSLLRLPRSEWLAFDSIAQVAEDGLGVVHTRLFDTDGAIGFILQSVQGNPEFRA